MIFLTFPLVIFFRVTAASIGPFLPDTQDKCLPGSAYNGDLCFPCLPNTFQPEGGQAECIPCPPSMMSSYNATECITCPSGQAALPGNECGVCPPGEYYVPEHSDCFPCSLNEFNSEYDLSTSCEPCIEGFASYRAASCTVCPPGEVLLAKSNGENVFQSKCGVCEPGHYYWQNRQACGPCQFNTFSTGGIVERCEQCPQGSFSLPGASSCTYCPRGEVLLESGCGRCAEGHGWDGQYGTCQICGPNHVSDGSTECRACTAGTFARSGSSSCFPCAEGTAYDVMTGSCTVCDAGYYYEFSRGQCEQCIGIAPYPNVKRSRLCELCPAGLTANEDSTACVQIDRHRNNGQDGNSLQGLMF
eukprot:TRINITY_DN40346_c0_g1_i1.p1 TRINITY_DN40346_c0_g1~~TRINITY_DN40346_c0_g1_i1.p1  ORF type:complete len:359 (+),score=-11.55 TRINITY_DN40346_c0_g1_i1:50-1126(+)